MGDYEDLPYVVIERRGSGFSPFLWGALLGAGTALLLAPRSGEETQDEIRRAAMRLRSAAEDRVDEARTRVSEVVDRGRNQLDDKISAVRDEFDTRTQQARHAVRAGRDAARQARGELERRVDEAKTAYRAGVTATRPAVPQITEVDIVVTEVIVEADPMDLL